jgi:hypothetical protein
MNGPEYPDSELIRCSGQVRMGLLLRANEFRRLTGQSPSAIARAATGDASFLSDLEGDRNITVGLLDKMTAYLDANWPREDNRFLGAASCHPMPAPFAATARLDDVRSPSDAKVGDEVSA